LAGFDEERPRFQAGTTSFFAAEDKDRAKHFLSENPLLLKKTRYGDKSCAFGGYNPILERFKPIGSP
jgi:hypothetical protein